MPAASPILAGRIAVVAAAVTLLGIAAPAGPARASSVRASSPRASSPRASSAQAGPVAAGAAAADTSAAARTAAAAVRIPPPAHRGSLRISGLPRDGSVVAASGLAWRVPRLPRGMRLLTFAVAYSWQSCLADGTHCVDGAGSTATPFAAVRYRVAHNDTGRRLRVTETASEVVETQPATFTFRVVRRSVSRLGAARVRAYPLHQRPAAAFINGTPERRTASAEEYFQVAAPYYNAADGRPRQRYRVDAGPWRALPAARTFYTGTLRPGRHQVAVLTANRAGTSVVKFGWQVVPLPPPLACLATRRHPCWYPPHLDAARHSMRWDWQIGRVTPRQRTGPHAVDIYDVDGFLTTRAEVRAIRTTWQASTLRHPRAVCYLDLAWEDYRPDASPAPFGRYFPAATLGKIYYGYPQERWVDFRQLSALAPMLRERIAMCARKGFDAVELDDIDGFDPPATTGFLLTPGDAQNYLAYAFNEIHRYGMTALWKNSPYLSWWGRRYADGAVIEECYLNHACFASEFRGSTQYGITCTGLRGRTPCGWDVFTTDVTRHQPTGKWAGEAEYGADHYVCNPGQRCTGRHRFASFCRAVYTPASGFAAMKLNVNLDGSMFYPCPRGR